MAGSSDHARRLLRFLSTHPTRRGGVNWAIWVGVFVILIAIGSANSTSQTGPAASSDVPTASLSAGGAARAPVTATTTTRPVTTPRARRASRSRVVAVGGDVIHAGAVLPNHARTPGRSNAAVTQATIHSTICVPGWTSTIRPASSYTTSLKDQQLASGYAYRGDTKPSDYEEDHLISLELGGSPTAVQNLWPEPYTAIDGARIKDRVENTLHGLVCSGQVSLAAAQHAIAANWFTAYRKYDATTITTAAPKPSGHTPAPSPAPGPGAPQSATGICNDGTYSYAAHHQGMCSHHGGVRTYLG